MNALAVVTHFRTYPDGDVIALFPAIFADYNGLYCIAYMLQTGHTGADDQYIAKFTRPSTSEEMQPLYQQLTGMGYQLDIRPEFDPELRKQRINQARIARSEIDAIVGGEAQVA